jgi:2-polyprenyl-3-methyl-5-hydroxy-6-metoxy-1,4-benzoquinol methylase
MTTRERVCRVKKMPNESQSRTARERTPSTRGWIDAPLPGATVYGESVSIAGWFFCEGRDPNSCRLRAWHDEQCIGETRIFFARADVSHSLGQPATLPTGFRLLARVPGHLDAPRTALIRLTASWNDEAEFAAGEVRVELTPSFLSQRDHGAVLFPEQERLLHREHIYGSGPPLENPGAEALARILEYLPSGASVLDVGCGAGAYGPALMAAGHSWLGLEVNPACCELLDKRALPYRKIEDAALPCRDGEFDAAICIEVLEHVAAPNEFLREIARVTQDRALFSVPNLEIVPLLKPWEVVPWHLLEADHKNFFTRASLRKILEPHFRGVEVFSYGELPLRARDGVPLHVHLFAVAQK